MKSRSILRLYDVLISLTLIIVSFFPIIILIILKLLFDGFPLFYNSKRVGKGGIPFTVYKFRTMINNREQINDYLKNINAFGFEQIPLTAEVYTKVGRFFEKYQIVELLQLVNVLEGSMSIIGYRPLPQSRVDELCQLVGSDKMDLRHSELPGITGFSQIIGKTKVTNIERIDIENSYNLMIKRKSQIQLIILNTIIIFETFVQIVFRRNILIRILKKKVINEISEYKK